MKITMSPCHENNENHEIRILFNSENKVEFTVESTEKAIKIYKAILFAYESGIQKFRKDSLIEQIKKARDEQQ